MHKNPYLILLKYWETYNKFAHVQIKNNYKNMYTYLKAQMLPKGFPELNDSTFYISIEHASIYKYIHSVVQIVLWSSFLYSICIQLIPLCTMFEDVYGEICQHRINLTKILICLILLDFNLLILLYLNIWFFLHVHNVCVLVFCWTNDSWQTL